ncbi:MAG: hypothetical protein A2X83_08360 [Desulfuromonadales bacterium GWD2_54_10]|nr:MAG: hypothetical protein A2X83_08360 [Desulfuromonadales bacterium GWD2_54_10]
MQLSAQKDVYKLFLVNVALIAVGMLSLALMGCTIKVVSPYDDKLFNDTEVFFKKANTMIEEGKSVSPLTDEERSKIDAPVNHPGHLTVFAPKYDALLLDTDALILRVITNSQAIDAFGGELHMKINDVIDKSIPSACPDLHTELGKVDLTAMNFVDLKCSVLRWKEQHADDSITKGKKILKKANWEGRKIALFDTILAIQKAEGFKNNK